MGLNRARHVGLPPEPLPEQFAREQRCAGLAHLANPTAEVVRRPTKNTAEVRTFSVRPPAVEP